MNLKKERNGAIDPISAEEKAQVTNYGEQVEVQGNRSGFMELEASGNLKRCRGKTLQVKVKPTANAQCSLDVLCSFGCTLAGSAW